MAQVRGYHPNAIYDLQLNVLGRLRQESRRSKQCQFGSERFAESDSGTSVLGSGDGERLGWNFRGGQKRWLECI